jgi:ribosomal protein S18 acetylase RimI-like enzyme
MKTVRNLLKHLIRIEYLKDDTQDTLLQKFERNVLYKHCFSNSCNVNLAETRKEGYHTCVAYYLTVNNSMEMIGCIQVIPCQLMSVIKDRDKPVIVNFCIHTDFRKLGIGKLLFKRISNHMNEGYICVDKEEPLNDSTRLVKFYNSFGFREIYQSERYIVMKNF